MFIAGYHINHKRAFRVTDVNLVEQTVSGQWLDRGPGGDETGPVSINLCVLADDGRLQSLLHRWLGVSISDLERLFPVEPEPNEDE